MVSAIAELAFAWANAYSFDLWPSLLLCRKYLQFYLFEYFSVFLWRKSQKQKKRLTILKEKMLQTKCNKPNGVVRVCGMFLFQAIFIGAYIFTGLEWNNRWKIGCEKEYVRICLSRKTLRSSWAFLLVGFCMASWAMTRTDAKSTFKIHILLKLLCSAQNLFWKNSVVCLIQTFSKPQTIWFNVWLNMMNQFQYN